MKIGHYFTVFEFGYLADAENAQPCELWQCIPNNAFVYLEQLCLDQQESQATPFLRLSSLRGQRVIQLKNYAGVIFTPQGVQIEVLPKTAKRQDAAVSRKSLLLMLKHLGQFRHIKTNIASIDTVNLPLLEIFIQQFLHSVNQLVKRGLRCDYVSVQGNLAFQKGKLLVAQQLRNNGINKHEFCVQYDEYSLNRPANRLLHLALNKIKDFTRSHRNQKLLRELTFPFHDIPFSNDIKQDFASLKLNRSMDYYHEPLAWAKLILNGLSPMSMQGNTEALSLLFPMESVFECYVASKISEEISEDCQLTVQAHSQHLLKHKEEGMFRLEPDLLISKQGKPYKILDTKWKLIYPQSKGSYGLSQSDFYQLFAYGTKYLNGSGELFLIYPAHDDFQEPIKYSFDFNNELKLWVVPCVIGEGRTGLFKHSFIDLT